MITNNLLGIDLGDTIAVLCALGALYCGGYLHGIGMVVTEESRFYRYFRKADWHALGHCNCCPRGVGERDRQDAENALRNVGDAERTAREV